MSKIEKGMVERLVQEYRAAKEFSDKATARTDSLKKELLAMVSEHGVPDDRGHKWLPGVNTQVKHERRVSRSFDLGAAEEWAEQLGILEEVQETIVTITENAVLTYCWDHQEHQDTLASFYVEKESWAFKVVDQKSYDDE